MDEERKPLVDASAFVSNETLDYITLSTYDIANNYRNSTGIIAPLDDACAPEDQKSSIKSAVQYWVGAGISAEFLQIGLPAYGKIFNTTLEKGADLKPGTNGSLAYQPKTMPRHSLNDQTNAGSVESLEGDQASNDTCNIFWDFGSSYSVSL